ncbi:hypothetical protein NL676_002893 [Syzygium grande]|nr:hypothetical protein NL676_002893 [Syzygium grande]
MGCSCAPSKRPFSPSGASLLVPAPSSSNRRERKVPDFIRGFRVSLCLGQCSRIARVTPTLYETVADQKRKKAAAAGGPSLDTWKPHAPTEAVKTAAGPPPPSGSAASRRRPLPSLLPAFPGGFFSPSTEHPPMAASVGAALPCRPLQHHGRTADTAPALPFPRQPENRSLRAGRSIQSSRKLLALSRRGCRVDASAVSGSAGVGASAVGEDTGDSLDDVRVFDLSGNAVPISDLWKDRKAVIAFARHFGCVLCRKRADYLAAKKDIMDASGVALVLIGPGKVDQAKAFSEQTKFQGEVYADPSHSAYEALRFVSGFTTTFTPGAGLKIIQSYMEGYRQDWQLSSEKETVSRGGWQQGGIIVAGPGKNNISYIHKDKEAGDDPPIEEIMRACCS